MSAQTCKFGHLGGAGVAGVRVLQLTREKKRRLRDSIRAMDETLLEPIF